ncbi:hypothetical protein GX48_03253 [Paracoccidioides brasiliensis]|nr:hypothetical protein GX48_03253 [Paracoccidioides brasiliensis]
MSLATIESPPVKLRDVESDDSFSFDDSLPAGFGSGHVYQGPWNTPTWRMCVLQDLPFLAVSTGWYASSIDAR